MKFRVIARKRSENSEWFFLPQHGMERDQAEYLLDYYLGHWGSTHHYEIAEDTAPLPPSEVPVAERLAWTKLPNV